MASTQFNNQLTIPQMLERLDLLYKREQELTILLEQIRDDIALGEQLVMYASNKRSRNGTV